MKRILLASACVCAVSLPVLAQQDDRSWLTGVLEDNLSGAGRKVTITGFEGALSSQARMAELTIADDDGIWLTLRDVVLDWNRAALLTGRVSVNTLTAAEIVLDRLPASDPEASAELPAPEAGGFSLPELPVSINIGEVASPRIALGPTVLGQPVEARLQATVSLSGGEGSAKLQLERTDNGPEGKLALDASFANESRVLALDLALTEGADGLLATQIGLPGTPAIDLTVAGEGPLSDYTADIRLASAGQDRLTGQITLASAEDGATNFGATLGGDIAPLFLPEFAEFFGPEVALSTRGSRQADGRLELSTLQLRSRAMQIDGRLALAADGLPQSFDIAGRLGLDGQTVLLPLASDQRTTLQNAALRLHFDAAENDAWSADIRLVGLERSDIALGGATIRGGGRIARPEGVALANGTLEFSATQIAASDPALAQALGDQLEGQIGFDWQQGRDALALPSIRLNGQDYGIEGNLNIQGLASALTLRGETVARSTDLSRFAALAGRPLAGQASLRLGGEAALLAGSFDLTGRVLGEGLKTGIAEADNLLAGNSTIDFSLRRDETGTHLRQLDIEAASLSVRAAGEVATSGSDISANLDFRDLGALGSQYRGRLTGVATFTGTPQSGVVSLNADASNIAVGVPELDNLLRGASTIRAEAGLAGDTTELRQLEVRAASLDVSARGTINPTSGHDLSADLNFRDLRALGGGYRGTLAAQARFSGTPEQGKLTATATGRGLAIGRPEADRVLAGESRLAADLALEDGRIQINSASLANPQLRAEARGSIEGSRRQVTLDAVLNNLGLVVPEFPGRLEIRGTAADDGQGYDVDLASRGPGGINSTLRGRIAPDFSSANLTINGVAQAALANAFISPTTVRGGVNYDLRLNGPLQAGSLNGRISVSDVRIANPALPSTVERLSGAITLASGRATTDLTGNISTGGGFSIGGGMQLDPPFQSNITVQLFQAVLRDPQLFTTRMNGTVSLTGPLAGGALIGGAIVLSETELRIPSTGIGGGGGLSGLRHIAEPGPVRATRARAGLLREESGSQTSSTPFPLDLQISAPQRIFVRGRGLDLEMGGQLRITGTTNNVIPTGAFELVRGRLDILGRRLTISEALLRLEGDMNPWIQVLASNENDGVTSSVQIEGFVSEPQVSFVSTPELPEEEVLARLLFGRDLSSLSAFQAAQLASAVATLAGRGGDGILSRLRQGFGLDDFDVSTDAEGRTEVRAGKYISRNAYTEVQVNGDGQAQINLNLDLTDQITLRGSVGDTGDTSIGIYKEKDY